MRKSGHIINVLENKNKHGYRYKTILIYLVLGIYEDFCASWCRLTNIYSRNRFWKWSIRNIESIPICSRRPIWQYVSVGSGNGLAPNMRRAIVWTNDDRVYRRVYIAFLGRDELTKYAYFLELHFTSMNFVFTLTDGLCIRCYSDYFYREFN